MKIKAQTGNKICVELTHEDMVELDITYEALDYSNIETRRVLWTLLDEARQKLGKNICLTQRMLIEAVPDDSGGCTIYFTVADEPDGRNGKKRLVKHGSVKTVCQSSNIDDIGILAGVLYSSCRIQKSELYTDGKNYRLIISPDLTCGYDIDATVCEYCDICDEDSAAYTYEYWKLIAAPDAVGVLAALS